MSPAERIVIDLPPVRRGFLRALAILAVVNVLALGGMRLFLTYYRNLPDWNAAPPIKNLYTQVNFAAENVAASWYSSMLLLLASLMAALCFGADRAGGRKKFAGGWLAVASVFLLLSFDEMGSLHERIGMLGILNPFGDGGLGWVTVLAIPIAAVTIYLAAFGWMRIRTVPRALCLFGLGLALLAANPVMEVIEMRYLLDESPAALRAHDRWVLAEEGAELFSFLLFSFSMLIYVASVSGTIDGCRLTISPRLARVVGVLLASGGVVTLFGSGLVNTYMVEGDIGQPANWPPSMLAGLNAVLLLLIASARNRGTRALLIAAAVFCLVLSAFHGACMRFWLAPSLRGINLALSAGAVALGLAFLPRAHWRIRLGIAAAVLTFVLALRAHPYHGGYLDVIAQGLLLVTVLESQVARLRTVPGPSQPDQAATKPPAEREPTTITGPSLPRQRLPE